MNKENVLVKRQVKKKANSDYIESLESADTQSLSFSPPPFQLKSNSSSSVNQLKPEQTTPSNSFKPNTQLKAEESIQMKEDQSSSFVMEDASIHYPQPAQLKAQQPSQLKEGEKEEGKESEQSDLASQLMSAVAPPAPPAQLQSNSSAPIQMAKPANKQAAQSLVNGSDIFEGPGKATPKGKRHKGWHGGKELKAQLKKEGDKNIPGSFIEIDVNQKPNSGGRDAERLVVGGGRIWYTSDHYKTFTEIT